MTNAEAIEALKTEAAAHGDYDMVSICNHALAGNLAALETCRIVMDDSDAQDDGEPSQ